MKNVEIEPIEEFSREELEQAFREAIEAVERLHASLTSAAEDAGYSRQILMTSQPRYISLYDKAMTDPSVYPIVASGLGYVKNMTIELNRLADLAGKVQIDLRPVSNSTGSFGSSISAATGMAGIPNQPTFQPLPAPLPRRSREEYTSRLKSLDQSLAQSYDQVWQTYYGTTADRHRASLYMMRQVFDHFFSSLAPDNLVRQSEYWERKAGDKPEQIYRSERVKYAAHVHIKNAESINTLAASAKHINDLYELANEAHNRGELNEDNADKALLAMDSILKDWIDAIR